MTDQDAPPTESSSLWWRLGMSAVRILAVVYVAFGALVFFFQSYVVYQPSEKLDETPSDYGLDFEDIPLTAEDGTKLHAWYVPRDKAKYTLLFCHGNGGNISHRIGAIQTFHGLGLNVLIFDYRGYGRSEGKPTEAGTYQDVEAAWKYLVETRGVPPERIVVFGCSLGGAIAAHLAHKHTPAALILESTFTSAPDAGAKLYPFLPIRWLCRFSYDTQSIIGEMNCPILVVHSRQDEMVPYEFGQALFDAARGDKHFLEISGSHNMGRSTSSEQYINGLAAFLRRVRKPAGPTSAPHQP